MALELDISYGRIHISKVQLEDLTYNNLPTIPVSENNLDSTRITKYDVTVGQIVGLTPEDKMKPTTGSAYIITEIEDRGEVKIELEPTDRQNDKLIGLNNTILHRDLFTMRPANDLNLDEEIKELHLVNTSDVLEYITPINSKELTIRSL